MELTNKDKIAMLEGLTIQVKPTTLEGYYKFEAVVTKWIESVLLRYIQLNDLEVFARHYGINKTQARNFILNVPNVFNFK